MDSATLLATTSGTTTDFFPPISGKKTLHFFCLSFEITHRLSFSMYIMIITMIIYPLVAWDYGGTASFGGS